MKCATCGKEIKRVRPCWVHSRRGEAVCDDCCDVCYESEPFPCPDHDTRVREELEG